MQALENGTIVAARYAITGTIGHGTLGAVHSARDVQSGMPVALKLLSLGPMDTDPLNATLQIAAGLQHRNTAQLLDFGPLAGGRFLVVMEHVQGRSLRARLKRAVTDLDPMSPAAIQGISAQVVDSLAEAHRRGLVHRNLQPSTILLLDADQRVPDVRVTGYGLSLDTLQQAPRSAMRTATIAYVSPEQLAGGKVDRRSDLFSAALCMVEAATGSVPKLALPVAQGDAAGIANAYTLLASQLRERLSDGFAAILERALAPHPSDRFRNANAMAKALRALDAGTLATQLVDRETVTLSVESIRRISQEATRPVARPDKDAICA